MGSDSNTSLPEVIGGSGSLALEITPAIFLVSSLSLSIVHALRGGVKIFLNKFNIYLFY